MSGRATCEVIEVDLSAAVGTGVLEELQMMPERGPLVGQLRKAVCLSVDVDVAACGFRISATWQHRRIRGHPTEVIRQSNFASVADPNCFRDAARVLAGAVEGHAARLLPIDQELDLVDPVDQQRLLALKAFWLARLACLFRCARAQATFAADVLELLGLEDANSPVTIRRQMFYLLLRATWQPGDQDLVRQACQLGQRFREFGGYTPLAPWERLVAAFRPPAAPTEDSWSEALAASRLPVETAQKYDWFLRQAELQDIAFLQGIL
jgi:hypothetical protein